MAIGAEQSDAIARLDAVLQQSAGEPTRAIGKLRVGIAFVVANHRGSSGILPFRVAEKTQGREGNIHSDSAAPGSGGLPSVDNESVSRNKIGSSRSEKDGRAF